MHLDRKLNILIHQSTPFTKVYPFLYTICTETYKQLSFFHMDSFIRWPNNSTVTKHISDILQGCCSANMCKIYSAVGLWIPLTPVVMFLFSALHRYLYTCFELFFNNPVAYGANKRMLNHLLIPVDIIQWIKMTNYKKLQIEHLE